MKYYFAPMEGITGYVFRNAYRAFFKGADKYFSPFISPNQNHRLTSREKNDVLPENNQEICLIPQILTNKTEDFCWASRELGELGYREVNLNLGCPSPTVVSKGKGAGFLDQKDALDRFLYEIYSGCGLSISIKTRLGMRDPEDFYELLEIFNRYPLKELIIHPRVREDYYGNKPKLAMFRYACGHSSAPLCYNGDLFDASGCLAIENEFPEINAVMAGRGAVANPGLFDAVKDQKELEAERFFGFHDAVYEGYRSVLSGDRNVLFKMKELWGYMKCLFPDSEKAMKRIRKADTCKSYEIAVSALFQEGGFTGKAFFQ